jgi:hypothetical protein
LPRSRRCGIQEIPHCRDRMPVAADHLADVGFAHLDFKNQFATLLNLCYQDLFWCFHQLPDDKLEKSLHRKLLNWRRGGLLAGFQNHTGDGRTRLSAMRHPIIYATKVQVKIFTGLTRIVIADHFYELSVSWTAFIRDHHPIERTVFGSFSP